MKEKLITSLILAGTLLVFSPTIHTYFSQDDWVFLSHTYKRSVIDVFRYYPEAFYRPIGQQLFFFINSLFFGLNAIGFHVVGLAIHLFSVFLLWKLLRLFGSTKFTGIAIVAFYATSSVHVIALNWLTQVDLEIAALFSLFSILVYQKAVQTGKRFFFIVSCFLFLLSLLSHETSAVLPLFLFAWFHKKRVAISMLVLSGLVLAGKYLINPFPFSSDYSLAIHPLQILSTGKWYVLRAIAIPEGIRNFPFLVQVLSLLSTVIFIIVFRFSLVRGLLAFLVGLLPVLFFGKHVFSVYAILPLLWMAITMSRTLAIQRTQTILLVSIVFLSSLFVAREVVWNHWTTSRGELSRHLADLYVASTVDEKEALKQSVSTPEKNPEAYFATMKGRQFEVLER